MDHGRAKAIKDARRPRYRSFWVFISRKAPFVAGGVALAHLSVDGRSDRDPLNRPPGPSGGQFRRGARKIPLSESYSATYREGTEGHFLDHKSKIEGELPFQRIISDQDLPPKHASAINKSVRNSRRCFMPRKFSKTTGGGGASKRAFGIPKNSGIPFALDAPWIGANRKERRRQFRVGSQELSAYERDEG